LLHRILIVLLATVVIAPRNGVAQTTAGLNPTPPSVTTILPSNTAAVLLINSSPALWTELTRFHPLALVPHLPFRLPWLPAGIDFTTDISPWLGDRVAIALLPSNAASDTVRENTVVLSAIKDQSRFNGFLDKLKASWEQPPIERTYQGVTILQWIAPSSPPEEQPDQNTPDNPSENAPSNSPLPTPQSQFESSSAPDIALQLKQINPTQTLHAARAKPTPPFPLPIPSIPQPVTRGVAIALFPNHVAIASQPETLEKLIRAGTETPLTQNPLFQRTIHHAQFERSLLVGYGEIAGISGYLSGLTERLNNPLPTDFPRLDSRQLQLLAQTYNTVDLHIWVQPEGIHTQTITHYTTEQPDQATAVRPDLNQILTHLPAATYLSANGYNFKQQWQRLIRNIGNNPQQQLRITSIRNSVRQLSGLNLEQELLPWMDGEYVLFLFPTTGGLLNTIHPQLHLGLGLMLQTSDRTAADLALKTIDQHVQSMLGKEGAIVSRQIKGHPFVSWEGRDKEKPLSFLAHGWVDDHTLIITSGVGAMAPLTPKPFLPLHLNPTFQTAIKGFPQPNDGYFYVNMGATLSLLYGLILPDLPPAYVPFAQQLQGMIGSIRSISTSTLATATSQQIDTLFVLAPVRP